MKRAIQFLQTLPILDRFMVVRVNITLQGGIHNTTNNAINILICFIFTVSMAACQLASPATIASPETPLISSTATELPNPTQTITPPVIAIRDGLASTQRETLQAVMVPTQITPAADPLRFVFPTQAPAPVSAWRPPLYPTPWAPTPMDHFFFSRPIAANEINWPLADYRYGGIFLPEIVHTGIDIPAPVGIPVQAVGSGRVSWAGYGLYRGVNDPTDPYGLAVAIKHDFGFNGDILYTVYGHLNDIDVVRGQQVKAGDLIGIVGETGQVTGPHLHFEVRVGKNNYFVSRNPELWLVPPQGWGVLAARVMNTRGNLLFSYPVQVNAIENGHFWTVKTYGEGTVNSDPYYQENMVLGDLPAGRYNVTILFAGFTHQLTLDIKPGIVNYFTFQGRAGFLLGVPSESGIEFIPPAS